jgi:hypothetical protein
MVVSAVKTVSKPLRDISKKRNQRKMTAKVGAFGQLCPTVLDVEGQTVPNGLYLHHSHAKHNRTRDRHMESAGSTTHPVA